MEKKIAEKLSKAAVLEQMAEEATELAQAALKYARILRGENPTPVTARDAEKALTEEYADVLVCVSVADEGWGVFERDFVLEERRSKIIRWLKRLEEKEESK